MPTDTALSRPQLGPLLDAARHASRALARADRVAALHAIADGLVRDESAILAANRSDVAAERARGTQDALVDRLELSRERLHAMAAAVRQVAALPDPLGRVLDGWTLPNGVRVRKVAVPFGVIGVVYESRPNVTVDAAVLALKAGSAAVLRGSSNALASNRALVASMRASLAGLGAPEDAVQLVDSPDRALVTELLQAHGKVDLVIPRGGAGLIRHVVDTARVPVIETGVGNCHLYVDDGADLAMAERILRNAKLQRPGVCNAIETLLVHRGAAQRFLPGALAGLRDAGVVLVGCEQTRALVDGVGAATEEDWATEYLDLELAVRVVDDLDAALAHIARYGTQHTEAIVTSDVGRAERFRQEVDAAVVAVNASTRFTDGFAFGFGAEIGISTQKLHARGPMGLAQIVTYKYLLDGEGQTRT
jgi:glutamate-5-semialdehyde dehydrogenase